MPERMAFTISEDATEGDVASVCQAALRVLWDDLEWFDIDLAGLEHERGCEEAVAALSSLRKRHWLSKEPDSVARLVPGRDDDRLPAVMPLLARTIGSTGLSRQGSRMVFDANDSGTSCLFELTPEQLERVRTLLADHARAEVLTPWSPR